jgi:hypothetical protein
MKRTHFALMFEFLHFVTILANLFDHCANSKSLSYWTVSTSLPQRRESPINSRASPFLRLRGGCTNPEYPAAAVHTESELQKMKLNELQKLLRERNLSAKGLKAELIKRLLASYSGVAIQTTASENIPAVQNSAVNEMEFHPASDNSHKRASDRIEDEDGPLDMSSAKRFALSTETNGAGPSIQAISAPVRIQIEGDVDTGTVRVYNCYPIKDKCRALGFKYEAPERAWTLPLALAMDLLGVTSPAEVTEAGLLQHINEAAPAAADAAARQASPPPLSVDVTDEEVRVAGGTYFFKDKLRYLGFRCDGSARPVNQLIKAPLHPIAFA